MSLPLNLSILRMVEEYKRIPRGLLYEKLPASNTEIDRQLSVLVSSGAIKVDNDDQISIVDQSTATVQSG